MKSYFCTLFDSYYLSRGLTMYRSLAATGADFHLYIFAFDDRCEKILKQLSLPAVTVVSLREFEDEELLSVKPLRSRAEYCWTCSSSTILYCLQRFGLPHCTYIDADLYFYRDPVVLLEEMGDHSVLITEHRYSPQYEKAVKAGIYCVQFITFKNDAYGLKTLQWWRDRCIEWCYARQEEGKFGDQKYLDDWPERFKNVWVLQHLGGGLAAWNIQQYDVREGPEGLVCTERKTGHTFLPVFYHFHYLRFLTDGRIELGRRQLSEAVKACFYQPYLKELEESKRRIQTLDNTFDPHGAAPPPSGLKPALVSLLRKLKGVYHIYYLDDFVKQYADHGPYH
ncbi:hypothetical protein [Compostibacter hankyongensis]|uniref:Glycosyl transferase n=1 Tax=Compostibacter hankyongensis TaxID=1007089 RepID=A0ABP8G673_9BACT